MKTTFRLIGAVATAAALFSSCKKEAFNEEVKPGTVEMTIIAGADDATRTVLGSDGAVTWSAKGETLKVLENNGASNLSSYTSEEGVSNDERKTMSFAVSLDSKTAETFDYFALYPSTSFVEDTYSDAKRVKVILPAQQSPSATSFDPTSDILVSKPVLGLAEQPTSLKLQFARVVAIGKMNITNLDTEEKVKKVSFTATGKVVNGRSYINLEDASAVQYGYYAPSTTVTLDYTEQSIAANEMTAYFTCWPFELAAEETFSVVVETENYTFTKDVTLTAGKSLAFKAGRASEFNVNFADVKGAAKEPVNLKYELVQASDDIVDGGKYLIVYNGNCALGQYNADKKYYEKVDVTADNNIITITDQSVVVISLEGTGTEGQFYIKDSDDQYMYYLGSSNVVQRGELSTKDAYYKWTVTKDKITNVGDSNRFFQYNTANPRFTCYLSSSNQKDVTLYVDRSTVKAKPSIGVQKALDVPSAETTASFPVTLTNVKTSSVNVYKDAACTTEETEWITADFNDDKTAVEYVVMNNTGESRTAYIKIHAQGPEASEATAIVTVTQAAGPGGGEGGETPSVGTVLWSDSFGDWGGASTTFSDLTSTISTYTYTGRSGYKDNKSVTLTASNDNVKGATSNGANMTSGHLWFNKSNEASVTTSAIVVYGATKVTLSFAQGGRGTSITPAYSFDGGTTWVSLTATSGSNANNSYTITTSGKTSILLKFTHLSSNAKNTRIDNLALTVAE